MEQLKEDLISIVGFLDWYGQFLPDHTRERLRIMEFISTMQAKENLPHNHELLAEALQMCKILRDRNQIYQKLYLKKQDTTFEIIRIQNRITLRIPWVSISQRIIQLSYNYTEICKFHSITF